MTTTLALLFLLAAPVHAEITSSSDLNCDFSSNCLWRNASSSEDSGDWIPSTRYEADPQHVITPRKGSEGFFAHTIGFMGRTVALLVSDVASCQLGGGNVKYWYYKTGVESQLEVCTRQPPGSKDPNSLKCYDGLSPSFAQQWIFRVVELPPLSQPFELVFRGTYYPPMDVIALTDIVYSSALCDAQNPWNRKKRLTPHLIGIHDWQQYRQSGNYRGETMIIVSQDTNGTETLRNVEAEEKTTPTTEIPKIELYEHTGLAPSSTTAASTTTTSTTPETTSISIPVDLFSTTESPTASTTDPLANFMNLLRQTAPVLPYIPVLVKTLQSVDLANPGGQDLLLQQTQSLSNLLGTGTNPDLRRSPVQASHFYNTDSSPAEALPTTEQSMVQLARKLGILDEEDLVTTVRPMLFTPSLETSTPVLVRNIYGMQATTAKPELAPTVYPPSLVKNTVVKRKIAAIKADAAAIQQKSNEELQKLHSKLFRRNENEKSTTTKAPQQLVVFKKPTPVESGVATKLTELTKYLPKGAASDLNMLREIPDLEGLTRGMDLTLVSKPGGFAKLKKQFVDRLMRRTMGLSYNDSGGSALPPPIVPVKVTRKMMRERSRKAAKRLRKSRV
ncbi:hypothetical protein Aduo_012168 [Ancylostoma duodenale]